MTSDTRAPADGHRAGSDYLWNTASSLMVSLSTVILLLVVTRLAGLEAAGTFSLAFAVGQQFQTLGMYEVRTYHVTDVRHDIAFGSYLSTRVVTVALMLLGIAGYAVATATVGATALAVFLVAALRALDAFEDVFVCEFQRNGRLDLGARACFVRSLSTTVVFSAALALTGGLAVSAASALMCSVLATVVLYLPPARGLFSVRPKWSARGIGRLLVSCLPLFLSAFISMYLANAPRFAIDHYLDATAQGYFAIIFMPAMVINLLSLMVFRPLLTTMATSWASGDRHGFRAIIRRGVVVCGLAFIVVAIVSAVAGPQVLQLVYGKDVSHLLTELLVLVAGGAMNAVSVILYYAMTTMRRQGLVLVGYVGAAVVMSVCVVILVPHWGLLGASWSYLIAMSAATALFLVFLVLTGRQRVSGKRIA